MSLGKLDSVFFCDFCGKNQHEVDQLIAGSMRSVVHICDECVERAMSVILHLRHPDAIRLATPTGDSA